MRAAGLTSGVTASIGGALAIAAVSTLGDFIWATGIPAHTAMSGIIHGAVLFLCIGLYLGTLANRRVLGATAAACIGALAAASYYVAAPAAGRSIMFVLWIAAWIALGLLNERLKRGEFQIRPALARGALAAAVSGVAFYLISGIWRPFNPEGWDYLVHFAAWTLAYFPGFAALLVSRKTGPDGEAPGL